jgi:aryl-alcohol dehydrogenase-like predicted oxidoreductase
VYWDGGLKMMRMENLMELRRLGRSGIKVSPLGLGTARIAGLGFREGETTQDPNEVVVDADEQKAAVRQIQMAVDLGVTLFDTADNYGQGLSERILGEALQGCRDEVVVVTKFGEDPMADQADPWALDADVVVRKCEASLRRLRDECIDLYLLHRRDYPLERAPALMEALEDLVRAGKIRYYGWSTDDVKRARLFASGEHCIAIEHRLNIFNDNTAMLALCQEEDLASLNRVPLLMGILTGRWSADKKLDAGDRRVHWFKDDGFLKLLTFVQELEPYLTHEGRSYVQGALGWIWARSPLAIPVPGFRNMAQMQDLVQAQQFGPLPQDVMEAISERVASAGFGRSA